MYSVAKFCNYISLSKFNKNRLVIIDLKRLVLFYFIDNLHYKKNDILFFIFICLFSGGVFKINKSICGSFSFYSFALVSKNIGVFLRNFINLYLPLLFIDNKLKWISCGKQVENCTVFYSNCPMIPELDLLTILCPTI